MTASILIIGDEILIGQTADTNSAYIAAALAQSGIRVAQIRSVGDNAAQITAAVTDLLASADLIIATGGLGPTKDDITKETLRQYFGNMPLAMHQPTLRHIEQLALCANFAMNQLNTAQAMIPQGCKVLPNEVGTAPGLWFEECGKIVIALPGVPFEMEHVMTEQALPRIVRRAKTRAVHTTALIYGIAESMLAQQIAAWQDALPSAWKLAYLPSPLGIKLRLSAYKQADSESAAARSQALLLQLQNIVPSHFVALGDHTLEYFAAKEFIARQLTLSVAESCTGGALSALLTAHSGSSAFFKGGIVAYDNAVKTQVLGVSPDTLANFGAVSEQCAIEMAQGARKLLGSDYALAATGIAGPTGGSADKPLGRVCIAVAKDGAAAARSCDFGSCGRQQVMQRAAAAAIAMAIKAIK